MLVRVFRKSDSMKKYYVYLARCSDSTLYTGYCIDLAAREAKHNEGDGARYTRSRRPVRIIYSETYHSRVKAMRRERQIKNWSKIKKEHLIKTHSSPR